MKPITAILALASTAPRQTVAQLQVAGGEGVQQVAALPSSIALSVPSYSTTQCDTWLSRANAADKDGSGGLSADEYHDFLMSIEEPPHIASYFEGSSGYLELDWEYKITHKALACQCVNLGVGEDCCKGANAEIPISVAMSADQSAAAREFRSDVCNSVSAVFSETIPTTTVAATTAAATTTTEEATTTTEAPATTTEAPATTTEAPATTTEAPATTTEAPAATTEASEEESTDLTQAQTTTTVAPATTTEAPGNTTSAAPETTAAPDVTTTEAPATTTEASEEGTTEAPATTTEAPPTTTEAPGEEATEAPAATTEAPEAATTAATVVVTATENGAFMNIIGSTLDYSTFDYSIMFDGDMTNNDAIPSFPNAEAVRKNTGENNVLANLINGFGALGNSVLQGLPEVAEPQKRGGGNQMGRKRMLRATSNGMERERRLNDLTLKPVGVTDVSCPENLDYAPKAGLCLNFRMEFESDSVLDNPQIGAFSQGLREAIDEGKLYAIIISATPDTNITGLGSPGAGINYETGSNGAIVGAANADTQSAEDDSGGLSSAAIIFIILGVIVIPVAIVAMYSRYKKEQNKERLERLQAYSASQHDRDLTGDMEAGQGGFARKAPNVAEGSDEGSVYSVGEGRDMKKTSGAGSSLAAMGAAGAMVNSKNQDSAAVKKEVEYLVKETNAPKSADELLKAYAGREEELLTHLRKMKAKNDKEKDVRDEVMKLATETNAPKSADEMLITYKGREEELLANLRKMKSRQMSHEEKASKRAEVEGLVAETGAPKGADELLETYEGREDVLIANLQKMKSKQLGESTASAKEDEKLAAIKAEVATLAKETNAPKSTDEMLASYSGREEELLKNLRKMKTKQEKDAEIKTEVEALVAETGAPKTADEMLASYKGREDELLKNLRKMKSKKLKSSQSQSQIESEKASIKAEVEQLVKDTNAPKTADELLSSYEGRESELVANLQKMKSKQLKDSLKASAKMEDEKKEDEKLAVIKAEVAELAVKTGAPKPADEMLASYQGREEELLKNLRKMHSKQLKASAKAEAQAGAASQEVDEKAEIKAEVTTLVNALNPGKTAEEMLAAYEGKEEELLKNLRKMKSKQDKAAAKKSAAAAPPAAPAPQAAPAADKTAVRAEVAALVEKTKPGKSAEDLLAAYEGREEELVAFLKKLQKSKREID